MKTRIIVGLLVAFGFLACLFAPIVAPMPLLGALCAFLASRELRALVPSRPTPWLHFSLACLVGLTAVVLSPLWGSLALAAMLAVGIWAALSGRAGLSILWPAAGLGTLLGFFVRSESPFIEPLFLIVAPATLGDTAALIFGKAWGRTPMAPKISPQKTWEGAAAHAVTAVLACIGFGAIVGVSWQPAIAIGLVATVTGQAGDLLMSQLKRQAGAKDTGTLLPGHGGVLDRLDSIFASGPFVYFTCALLAPPEMFHVKHLQWIDALGAALRLW
jgi:phosphatidate cytidylyltransferase